MRGINTIIWDWNGTLLNDTDICIDTINELLTARNLPNLNKTEYLDVFGFPVKDYYRRIGFDFEKEPFEIPAHQYIEIYSSKIEQFELHEGVHRTLNSFSEKGFNQLILSASEKQKLEELLRHFKIREKFEAIAGLDNHYAQSKTEIGKQMLSALNIQPSTACLIGDTVHDFDVACELGCTSVLIANGHQSFEKLNKTGAIVLANLGELNKLFGKG